MEESSGSRFEVLFGMDQTKLSEVGVQNMNDFFNGISKLTLIPHESPNKKIGYVVIGASAKTSPKLKKTYLPKQKEALKSIKPLKEIHEGQISTSPSNLRLG